MTTIVLTPCKLRLDRIVPQKGAESLVLDWRETVKRLAVSGQPTALANLRRMDRGSFVGLARDARGQIRNFVLKNPDRSDKVDWLLARDPSFPDRLVEVYRVEAAQWESTFTEAGTPEQTT